MERPALLTGFAAWLAALAGAAVTAPLAAPIAQPPGDAENGKKAFERLGCLACHGSAGEGVSQAGQRGTPTRIAATHLSLAEFVRSVREPRAQMPPFAPRQVSDAELGDIYAFLQSQGLKPQLELPSGASPEKGRRLYMTFGCFECHGLEGQGSVQTGGSRFGPPQTPYSSFVAYVRQPAGRMPPYAPKVVSDAQLADIYAFLRSIPPAAPGKSIPELNR